MTASVSQKKTILSFEYKLTQIQVDVIKHDVWQLKCVFVLGLLFTSLKIYGQFYERTNQNIGMYVSGSPLNQYLNSQTENPINFMNVQGGVQHMFHPGITGSIGYSYSKSINRANLVSNLPFNEAHMLHTGVLFDKQFVRFKPKYYGNLCHFLMIGLIGSVDYAFMLPNTAFQNQALGEFSGTVGFSLVKYVNNKTKRDQSWTTHFDFFYRHGFTNLVRYEYDTMLFGYKRREIGIRLRIYKHNVFDFLK
jgi:hypothetical protein